MIGMVGSCIKHIHKKAFVLLITTLASQDIIINHVSFPRLNDKFERKSSTITFVLITIIMTLSCIMRLNIF
jgi:hypothetical protein